MQITLEGHTLGKYRVLEALGRGGMARVYRAYHPQLDRYVAVKVLRSDLVDDASFLARFQREARAVAALRHPNIVQVFDFDVEEGVYYMVMELLEGDTLKARLNDYRVRGEAMPSGETVRILLDVLDALAYAHGEGMIHRDIKPANILLTRRGQAVLGDFGIAQIIGETRHTAADALMGTVAYVAPEQGMEGRSDARSDIYSLGIVAYELLTRQTPFEADTPLATLMKHVHDPLPLPRQLAPDIPLALERVVLKALAKDAADRYQSAGEMAQALRAAAEEANIALPDCISLPLSFSTQAAPDEAVAVLSGAAREHITDAGFAADETDITLGQRLGATASETPAQAKKSPRQPARKGTGWIITGTALYLVFCNLVGVMVNGLLRQQLFRHGWPFELLLIALLLAAIMGCTSNIWLLIPAGIVLGNGLLFAFYSLTGWWELWSFLWPLELILIGSVIALTLWLSRLRHKERIAELLGLGLSLFSLFSALIVAVAALAR